MLSPDERSHFPFFTENSVSPSACCGEGVFRASGSWVACRLSHPWIFFPWPGRRSVCYVHPDALPHIVQPALVRRVSDCMALITCSNLTHSSPLPPRLQTPPPPPATSPPPPKCTCRLCFRCRSFGFTLDDPSGHCFFLMLDLKPLPHMPDRALRERVVLADELVRDPGRISADVPERHVPWLLYLFWALKLSCHHPPSPLQHPAPPLS